MFDSVDVAAELQEQLSIFLLDAELLDVESTEPVEHVERLQRRLHFANAHLHERLQHRLLLHQRRSKQVIAPGAARQYAPRRWQVDSRRIYVRPRTGPQSAHLWWPPAAGSQRADRLGSCVTQPRLAQTEGRIAISLNAHLWRGHITKSVHSNLTQGCIATSCHSLKR